MKMKHLEVFQEKPKQWGLRGDPFLWKDLKQSFNNLTIEPTQKDFCEMLESRFNEIIEKEGEKKSEDKVFFKKYSTSGMSGGFISLEWWHQTGLLLLKKRYAD